MKQIIIMNKLDITMHHEKFSNGLDVYLVPIKDKKKYYITLGTYFGSTTTEFTDYKGNKVKVPNGIAHFLEHKVFASKNGIDPMSFYSKSGTDCNASTSYNNTKYIVLGTKNFKENFEYLIDFVMNPYFTEENVEKEKGIIAQEINMYKDDPESRIDDVLRANLYVKNNRKINVAGEVADIEKITKDDLYTCYNTFYNPNNMFLVIAGSFSMKDAEEIIKDKLEVLMNRCDRRGEEVFNEPLNVVKDYVKEEENVLVPKMLIGFKMKSSDIPIKDDAKRSIYISAILTANFGKTSKFYEKMTEDNLLSSSTFYTERAGDITTVYFGAESTFPDELLEKFKEKLKNLKITKDSLDRLKKVYIASEIRGSGYVNSVMGSLVGDLVRYHKVINDPVDLYESLNIDDAKKVLNSLNFDNMSTVIFIPKNMKSFKENKIEVNN